MLPALIKKELLALVRDMHGLAVLFLMPMVFIVLMSLTLKDIYRPPLAELAYAVDARDTATPAKWLLQIWQAATARRSRSARTGRSAFATGRSST
jgi:ABC-2 type transport system permease protein